MEKPKIGRPLLAPEKRLSRVFTVRLSPAEMERLEIIMLATNSPSRSRAISELIRNFTDEQVGLALSTNRALTALAVLEQAVRRARPH